MVPNECHHLYSMVGMPDSTPETWWQQYKSVRIAETLAIVND